MADANNQVLLKIVVDRSDLPAALKRVEAELGGVKGRAREMSDEFQLSNARARGLAAQGLAQLGTAAPGVVGVFSDLITHSGKLAAGLQAVAVAIVAVEGARALMKGGKALGDLFEFGESEEAWVERMKQRAEEERKFLGARGALAQFAIEQDRRRLEVTAELTAAQLRDSGQVVRAIEVEREARLATLDLERRELEFKLSGLARTEEGQLEAARQRTALEERLAEERRRINLEADRAIREARDEAAARDEERQRELDAAASERRQAELGAQAEIAQGEGRLLEAARLATAQRLEQIRAEAEQRIRALQEAAKADPELAARSQALRLEIVQATSAKILAVYAQEAQATRELFDRAAASTAAIVGPRRDPAELRRTTEERAQALREAERAARLAGGVGLPTGRGEAELRSDFSIAAQIERLRAQDAALDELQRRRMEHLQALNAEAAEQNRPNLLEGRRDVERLNAQINEQAEAFAKLQREGVPLRELLPEIDRQSAALAQEVEALNQRLANSPAALELVRQKLGDIPFGGFAQRVRDASAALGETERPVAAVTQRLLELGPAAGAAGPSLATLKGQLDTVRDSAIATAQAVSVLNQVLAAGGAVAAGEPTGPNPGNTGIQVVDAPVDLAGSGVE